MQENDFEKQVHQKMGELKLVPSESVWEQVDMRLHQEEKRRRWIIWFPILALGLTLGGYFALNRTDLFNPKQHRQGSGNMHDMPTAQGRQPSRNSTPDGLNTDRKNSGSPIIDCIATAKRNPAPIQENKEVDKTITPAEADKTVEKNTSGLTEEKVIKETEIPIADHKKQPGAHNENLPGRLTSRQILSTSNKNNALVSVKAGNKVATAEGPRLFNDPTKKDNISQHAILQPEPVATTAVTGEQVEDAPAPGSTKVNVTSLPLDSANTSLVNIADKGLIKITAKYKSSAKWEWGLSLQGGKSYMNNGSINLNKIFNGASADALSLTPSNQSVSGNPTTNAIYHEPYPTHASAAFSAGAFLKKSLSKTFSLSIGVNYTYFSTTTRVGQKVDSSFQVTSLGFASSFDRYFRIGSATSYTNKYHYIEVPVLLQTKLTRNWKNPLAWDFGFSVQKMVASNALHFNNTSGIYYKDNALLNKTQFNIITGLPLQVTSGKNFGLQAGPVLQYGMSDILSTKTSEGKHFLFFGLKANVVLGKK